MWFGGVGGAVVCTHCCALGIVHGASALTGVYYEQGKLDEAVATYKQALAIEPVFPEAYNNLGNTLREAGRHEEAVGYYITCIRQQMQQQAAAVGGQGLAPQQAQRLSVAYNNLGGILKMQVRCCVRGDCVRCCVRRRALACRRCVVCCTGCNALRCGVCALRQRTKKERCEKRRCRGGVQCARASSHRDGSKRQSRAMSTLPCCNQSCQRHTPTWPRPTRTLHGTTPPSRPTPKR